MTRLRAFSAAAGKPGDSGALAGMSGDPAGAPGKRPFGVVSGFSRTLSFAWRSLVRQPARATLGILGVAAVGALLFDMLLLSEGLVRSMRDLFDRQGFDIRVTASDAMPGTGPEVPNAGAVAESIARLPEVRAVITLRLERAQLAVRLKADTTSDAQTPANEVRASFLGAGGTDAARETTQPWTVLRGADITGPDQIVVNEYAATTLGIEPGALLTVRASCSRGAQAPPPMAFTVTGIVRFPFDAPDEAGVGTTASNMAAACGDPGAGGPSAYGEEADFLLVTSNGDPAATADAILALHPHLRTFTNEELLGRLQAGGFTYFQQISTVLTTVTVAFALLLITVLLTVSVNQRLGDIAALRALGFSARRVAADVFCESALLVGIGGLISLPLGLVMATWLDNILKRMPGIPAELHFFVFDPSALVVHAGLLALTAFLAALYPMQIVARLPIAATLRAEVVS